MKHAATRALFAYWDRLRAGRTTPERADFDPAAIRAALGDVFLLEIDGAERYLLRLAGTRICTLLGRELKGRSFSDCFVPADWTGLFDLLGGVAETATPVVAAVTGHTVDERTVDLEMLALPLRHRGRTHARMIGSLAALEAPYWLGANPVKRLSLGTVRHLRRDFDHGDEGFHASQLRPLGGRLRVLPGGRV